jgi:hypothetical protein
VKKAFRRDPDTASRERPRIGTALLDAAFPDRKFDTGPFTFAVYRLTCSHWTRDARLVRQRFALDYDPFMLEAHR